VTALDGLQAVLDDVQGIGDGIRGHREAPEALSFIAGCKQADAAAEFWGNMIYYIRLRHSILQDLISWVFLG
jgi:hypothetical protein